MNGARVEDVAKTFYQGGNYMHFGSGETEYMLLGRTKTDGWLIKKK